MLANEIFKFSVDFDITSSTYAEKARRLQEEERKKEEEEKKKKKDEEFEKWYANDKTISKDAYSRQQAYLYWEKNIYGKPTGTPTQPAPKSETKTKTTTKTTSTAPTQPAPQTDSGIAPTVSSGLSTTPVKGAILPTAKIQPNIQNSHVTSVSKPLVTNVHNKQVTGGWTKTINV